MPEHPGRVPIGADRDPTEIGVRIGKSSRWDLMAALKRSLVQEPPVARGAKTNRRAKPDRRQRALLLPVSGGRKKKEERATEPATVAARGRKKA